jgi:hypothetical protein
MGMSYSAVARAGALRFTGAPAAGTNEVWTVATTGTPTGGTFRLRVGGRPTAPIAYNAAAAVVEAAVEALGHIGNVITSGGGPLPTGVTLTFTGVRGAHSLGATFLAVFDNSLTGGATPTVTVTRTTPGVDATLRGAPAGTIAVRTDTGGLYINTGTPNAPVWAVVGAQAS